LLDDVDALTLGIVFEVGLVRLRRSHIDIELVVHDLISSQNKSN